MTISTNPPGLTTRPISPIVAATRSGVSKWCMVATLSARSNTLSSNGSAVEYAAYTAPTPLSSASRNMPAEASTPTTL